MTVRIKKMSGIAEVNSFLRGGIISGDRLIGKIYGLDGKTIVFTSPSAATVTFATPGASAQEGLTLKEIMAQINAVIAGLATAVDGRLHLDKAVPGSPVVYTVASTAPAILGLPTSYIGVVYNPPNGVAPRVLDVDPYGLSGSEILLFLDD